MCGSFAVVAEEENRSPSGPSSPQAKIDVTSNVTSRNDVPITVRLSLIVERTAALKVANEVNASSRQLSNSRGALYQGRSNSVHFNYERAHCYFFCELRVRPTLHLKMPHRDCQRNHLFLRHCYHSGFISLKKLLVGAKWWARWSRVKCFV